jgi:hypothetical protein
MNRVEDNEALGRVVLSMRVKMCLGGLCFFLVMGYVFQSGLPCVGSALRSIAQGAPPADNSSQENNDDLGDDYRTVFLDDFDLVDPYWNPATPLSMDSSWVVSGLGETPPFPVSTRDGYAFLNTTTHRTSYNVSLGYNPYSCAVTSNRLRHKYAGVETRLRCSDDNKLGGDVGGGTRAWGFVSWWLPFPVSLHRSTGLRFEAYSPESDQPLPGFWATSRIDDTVIRKPIGNIDMTEWHTYTILWEPGNATFLVDGVVVAIIDEVPTTWMRVGLFMSTYFYEKSDDDRFDVGCLAANSSMQIDYVRVFYTEKHLHRIGSLFNTTEKVIESHRDVVPASGLEEVLKAYDMARDAWDNEAFYNASRYLEGVVGICELFYEAAEAIQKAEPRGIHPDILVWMRDSYAAAGNACTVDDFYEWVDGWTGYGWDAPSSCPDLLDQISGDWDELSMLLSSANEAIREAETVFIYPAILAGMKHNYQTALRNLPGGRGSLQAIFDSASKYFDIEIPEEIHEPPILSILGLILLPALLRRV